MKARFFHKKYDYRLNRNEKWSWRFFLKNPRQAIVYEGTDLAFTNADRNFAKENMKAKRYSLWHIPFHLPSTLFADRSVAGISSCGQKKHGCGGE
jgi:hypothetical protein